MTQKLEDKIRDINPDISREELAIAQDELKRKPDDIKAEQVQRAVDNRKRETEYDEKLAEYKYVVRYSQQEIVVNVNSIKNKNDFEKMLCEVFDCAQECKFRFNTLSQIKISCGMTGYLQIMKYVPDMFVNFDCNTEWESGQIQFLKR